MEFSDEEVLNLALTDSDEAKDYLYNKYKYIVSIILNKYHNAARSVGLDMKELEGEAYYAFSDALKSYKEGKNAKLSTFISLCIDRRINKVIKRHSGEKAKLLKNTISLDYSYTDGLTLSDIISDDEKKDPLYNLTDEENYQELLSEIIKVLSDNEREVLNYLLKGVSYSDIATLENKNLKQINNTVQRIRTKIRNIIDKNKN